MTTTESIINNDTPKITILKKADNEKLEAFTPLEVDPPWTSQPRSEGMADFMKERLGLSDFKDKRGLLWKACAAELIGNLLLNFFGCASTLKTSDPHRPTDLVQIALTFGLVIFVVVQAVCHVSGAHLNPAVTVAMLMTGKIALLKALLYIAFQCIGAVCGSAILKALTSDEGNLGMTTVNSKLSPLQGFGVEFFLGFVLVLVVFGVCDPHRSPITVSGPLAIGLAVAVGHLAAVDLTGASMNPARTFGSAVISAIWDNHWVYWLGPIGGGLAAAIIYQLVFAASKEDYSPVRIEA